MKMNFNWKTMNWTALRRRTIRQRLVILFAVLVGGFTLVAGAYWTVVTINRQADTTSARVSEFGFYVDRILIGVLQARREEKDFFARPKEDFLKNHEKALAGVYRDVALAEKAAPDAEKRALIGDIRDAVKTYQGTFRGAVEAQRRSGYDDRSGLQGALRTAMGDVETLLEKYQRADITASLLRMRTYEKDYLQRPDPIPSRRWNRNSRSLPA